MVSLALAGRTILITRPRAQAGGLAAAVSAAGGRPWLFPTIEIEPLALADPAGVGDALGVADLVIFVSVNAVRELAARLPGLSPPGRRRAAIGAKTAAALAAAGWPTDLSPAGGYTSEDLLALPELADLTGWRVVIVRGEGGRAALAEGLAARGAEVTGLAVYRRRCPRVDTGDLQDALEHGAVDAVTTQSGEALENLLQLLGPGVTGLRHCALVVPGRRCAELAAARLGAGLRLWVAADATDEAVLQCLQQGLTA